MSDVLAIKAVEGSSSEHTGSSSGSEDPGQDVTSVPQPAAPSTATTADATVVLAAASVALAAVSGAVPPATASAPAPASAPAAAPHRHTW